MSLSGAPGRNHFSHRHQIYVSINYTRMNNISVIFHSFRVPTGVAEGQKFLFQIAESPFLTTLIQVAFVNVTPCTRMQASMGHYASRYVTQFHTSSFSKGDIQVM